MPAPDPGTVRAAEAWFTGHGLPYFVDGVREKVRQGLARRRLVAVALAGAALGAVVGGAVGWFAGDPDTGVAVGIQVLVLVLLWYAATTLRAGVIAIWAGRRTLRSLGLLFPLVTRALPLLLLFITFLFINAEVWEVASGLDGSVMWLTVALFMAITVGFLLARLPEELDVFDQGLDPARVVAGCRGTPLEQASLAMFDSGDADTSQPETSGQPPTGHPASAPSEPLSSSRLAGLQRANLVLVLLIAQIVQVLLLSLSVFLFFVVFGLLIMEPDVIRGWTGEDQLQSVPFFERVNRELFQVSTFLAAFSGLYFTVYAVTDEIYRRQFFSSIVRELERAVSARVVYRALRRDEAIDGGEAAS